MKKIFMLLGLVFILSGCGKYNDKNLVKDISKKVNDSKGYHMTATLEIFRNEEKYSYDVDSSYKKGDFFKVDLVNQNNNHEQIILKNDEGVYVLTPSLNKSFKFQSDWPYNNSQIYLLQPIITDLNNDGDRTFEKNKSGYVLTSNVKYSTEKDFKKQKVYVDLDKNITKVEVLDSNDNVKMRLNVINIDYKAVFDDDYFKESKYQTNNSQSKDTESQKEDNITKEEEKDSTNTNEKQSETGKIEDIVYPMYVPVDTHLSGQDVVNTDAGERVILTFAGESSFTVIQENLSSASSTNYVYGDPYLILDTVGAITDYSVSWISNGVEYSVMSDDMNIDELLTVAQSISVKAVGK